MDSIIFDLDGTIWDSIDTVLMAWNSIVEENEKVKRKLTRRDFEGTMGLQMDGISSKLFPNLDLNTRTKIIKQCFEIEGKYIEEHGGVLFENVEVSLYPALTGSKTPISRVREKRVDRWGTNCP
ncbi:HAD hydrolase-like protein [Rummeliibacillus suwonensis]|uniref:HAD hydrolase-like protein n=1 Tax=Rummeliibacillus suwonensis TaxID=1306154 RepID=UPI0028A1DB8C|nr:HAD hydrolase-like protein [Rummeliibacillus suwonensis]